ncbi:MAG: DNA repair protein RecN [Cardiobacteriaceae bacterium]|nr:DNA repair protein RecN [Cardiobacteriaceae bacterium]
MLEQLSIKQFAIIEETKVSFQSGFNVLSGETGAGKSILIDALGLILGQRAEASMIRHGQSKAQVSACFVNLPERVQSALLTQELSDSDDMGQILIRRTLSEQGSKAYINDHAITAQTLKSLASHMVSIHGQHSNQALLRPEEQRKRLDRYAGNGKERERVKQAYRAWQTAQSALEDWQAEQSRYQEKMALLSYQFEEFQQLKPERDEFSGLSERHQLLSSADEVLRQGHSVYEQLHEGDYALTRALRHLVREARGLASEQKRFVEVVELLEQSALYADEAADALSRQLAQTEHNPEELARLDSRLSALYQLARKHHIKPEDLYEHGQLLAQQYHALANNDQQGEALAQALAQAEQDYRQAAKRLSETRIKAAKALSEDVEHWIRQLGMERARFTVACHTEEALAEHGMDSVQFLLCANPGQPQSALAKVASGGELSRVSLAIEVATLDEAPVPTIIFDEIDSGIGGEVAHTIGRLLQKLGEHKQVICITHLAQVACYANAHFRIEKQSDEQSTQTRLSALDDNARVQEIARMLGSTDSKNSLEHAKEMLNKARG